MTKPVAQVPSGADYALHTLGWKAFQDLCGSVLGEVLGQTAQGFLPSNDGGRDGAFYGKWTPTANEVLEGSFVVQCKFTSKPNESITASSLADEIEKVRKLAKKGLCENYIVITNHVLTGSNDEKICAAFEAISGVTKCLCFGADWLRSKINESSRLRMLVPRVYGLGDISQILDGRKKEQAEAILSSMREDLSKIVITDAYKKAAKALAGHGFVVLLGQPASGKSIIGASLALAALDNWGSGTIRVRDAADFEKHWNPKDPSQFFWVDDAFGATQFQRDLANDWSKAFPLLNAAVKSGARVLFTSRDYIFSAALRTLKTGAFPLLSKSQVIINVQDLSEHERQQILYNHIKHGGQPVEYRSQVKPLLNAVASNENFLPEIARRLGNPIFTRDLVLTVSGLAQFVDSPMEFLVDVIEGLDSNSQAAIALVFMRGGQLLSPVDESLEEADALTRLGADKAGWKQALSALEGSLLSHVQGEGSPVWTYKHPTVGDAFAEIVANDPELLDIYLGGAAADRVIREVVCGNVTIEGAKVVIPRSRYASMISRLAEVEGRPLYEFLAERCDEKFIRKFVSAHPGLAQEIVTPGAYLHARPEVALLAKLKPLDLVPKEQWERFIEHIREQAISTPDADFLGYERIRAMFSDNELEKLMESVRSGLLPNMGAVLDEWKDNYVGNEEDPDSYLYLLRSALRNYRDYHDEDEDGYEKFDVALDDVFWLEKELEEDYAPEPDDWDMPEEVIGSASSESSERSIFDDVDL